MRSPRLCFPLPCMGNLRSETVHKKIRRGAWKPALRQPQNRSPGCRCSEGVYYWSGGCSTGTAARDVAGQPVPSQRNRKIRPLPQKKFEEGKNMKFATMALGLIFCGGLA